MLACMLLGLAGTAVGQQAGTLPELESLVREHSREVRALQADVDVLNERLRSARASNGTRLYGGAGVAHAREPITQTLDREYNRVSTQIGVRVPVLGSRDLQRRGVQEAELQVELADARTEHRALADVERLRAAWIDWQRSDERRRIAEAFLSSRASTESVLRSREQRGMLLSSDLMDLGANYDAVQSERERQAARQQAALRTMQTLTGVERLEPAVQPIGFDEKCLLATADGTALRPALDARHAEIARRSAARMLDDDRFNPVEGGINVFQSLSRDIGGLGGHATGVSLDVSVPLDWKEARNSRRSIAAREQERADAQLDAAIERRTLEWRDALDGLELRRRELERHLGRQKAALEQHRIGLRRLEAFDGDGYPKSMMARQALYNAAMQVADGRERVDLAMVQLGTLTESCKLMAGSTMPSVIEPDTLKALAAKGTTEGTADAGRSGPGATDVRVTSLVRTRGHRRSVIADGTSDRLLGWYVWDGQRLLERPSMLATLPRGTGRLLLSMRHDELIRLSAPDDSGVRQRQRLDRLIALSEQRGIAVELLLGESDWVRKAERQKLLELLRPLAQFGFKALNLDLERSQLPPDDQRHWADWTIETIREVRRVVPWRLALTSHWSEANDPRFRSRLLEAGVDEFVAMAYVTRDARIDEISDELLRRTDGLRIGIAQSIESTLPDTESRFRSGRRKALAAWSRIAARLQQQPAFSGVVVQSLEEFRKARP